MACPIVTGKGYTFSDPVVRTGTVGETTSTTAEFTAFPQEGFFLRADHFYLNSTSEYVSDVQYTQNGNDVDIVATLEVDAWPGADTVLDIDLEYLYLDDSVGLDPIVREQKVTIFPVDNPNVTTLVNGQSITAAGLEVTLVGVCGTDAELPEITVVPNDGFELLDGPEDVTITPSMPGIVYIPAGLDANGDPIFSGTYTFDEDDVQEGSMGTGPGDVPSTEPIGVEIMIGVPFEDVVDEDLLDPEASDLGLSVTYNGGMVPLMGGQCYFRV